MEDSLHEYEVICCATQQETNFSLLQRASIVIVDLTNDLHKARSACREYAAMMVHLTETHWIFMVPLQIYPMAVELLLRSESTLLSSMEPIDGIINAIRSGSRITTAHLYFSGNISPPLPFVNFGLFIHLDKVYE